MMHTQEQSSPPDFPYYVILQPPGIQQRGIMIDAPKK
jgi:hypothetical protein